MSPKTSQPLTVSLVLSLLGAAVALGCSQTLLEEKWSLPYRDTTQDMIANPDAGNEAEIVENLDPLTGELVIETYKSKRGEPQFEPRSVSIIDTLGD